jgi:hypothetical protein
LVRVAGAPGAVEVGGCNVEDRVHAADLDGKEAERASGEPGLDVKRR